MEPRIKERSKGDKEDQMQKAKERRLESERLGKPEIAGKNKVT